MLANLALVKKQSANSESDLIQLLKRKDEKAFSFLYLEYSAVILIRIRRMVGCMVTAEDILQNVFLKIWLNIDNYTNKKGSLFTWMISIARNESIDYLRSKLWKNLNFTDTINEKEIQLEAGMGKGLDHLDILRSLALLQVEDQAILELYNSGYTCREVSSLLSLPVGTVKTKMRRSYKTLRKILA